MTHRHFIKDSGWGWLIVLGSFLAHFITAGLGRSMGIIQQKLAMHFEASTAYASLPSVVCFTSYGLTTSFGVIIAEVFTIRKVVICGAVFGALGLGLSSLLVNMPWFIFLFGVSHGIGVAFFYGNCFIILGQYFDKRRSLATGFALAGISCGHLFMPPIIEFLFENYGLGGATLIFAGIYLHIVVTGALYRTVDQECLQEKEGKEQASLIRYHLEEVDPKEIEACVNPCREEHQSSSEKLNSPNETVSTSNIVFDLDKEDKKRHKPDDFKFTNKQIHQRKDKGMREKLKRMVDFSVLKNRLSFWYILYSFCLFFGYYNVMVTLPGILEEQGIHGYQTAFQVSLGGVGDLSSRLIIGFLADAQFIQRHKLKGLTALMASLNVLLFILDKPFEVICLQSFVFGFLGGSFTCLLSLVCFDFIHSSSVTKTLALALPTEGLAVGLGQPFLGYMKDVTGSYNTTCVTCAIFYFVGGIMVFFLPLVARIESKRGHKKTDIKQRNGVS